MRRQGWKPGEIDLHVYSLTTGNNPTDHHLTALCDHAETHRRQTIHRRTG